MKGAAAYQGSNLRQGRRPVMNFVLMQVASSQPNLCLGGVLCAPG